MIKVIHAASWLARRHFYSFSHQLYRYRNHAAWQEPAVWGGRDVLIPEKNRLLHTEHTLLMAVENGQILARALTGLEAGNKVSEGRQGYFALFDAMPRKEAVQALTNEMLAWHRQRGSGRIIGPIAPTPVDLGGGVLYDGFSAAAFGDVFNMPYYDEYLRSCGFKVESEWLAYRIDIAQRFDAEKYCSAAERLKVRFGYRTEISLAQNPRKFADALCEIMDLTNGKEHMNRVIGQLVPFLERRLCPVVYVGKMPVGFLLTIKKSPRPPRIVTLWVHESWRRKGVTAVLFDCFAQEAGKRGIRQADASLIREDNAASWLGAEHAGGQVIHRYRQYQIQV